MATQTDAPPRAGLDANAAYRIQPGPKVALFAVVAYSALVIGTMATSGIAYEDFFDTGENVWRAPVLGLAVGSAFLIALTAYARWDFVWRDPGRLPMSKLIWAPVVLMVAGFLVRFAGIEWGAVEGDLILPILISGVGVGFAEETLFRGIVLRSMRTGGRTEAHAALVTAVAFGLFHLTNVLLGTGPEVLVQVFLATMSGFTLYLIRRGTGAIFLAMAVHGLWDVSSFFGHIDDDLPFGNIANGLMFLNVVVILVAWHATRKHDKHLRWQESGTAIAPGGPIPAG